MKTKTQKTIGIPRALYFFQYGALWTTFFRSLGHRPVVSPPTDGAILGMGLKGCVHDVCLPLKAAYGHVEYLKNRVEFLFLPRLMALSKGTYVCPKIVAFTDLARETIPDLPGILHPEIDLRNRKTQRKALLRCGRRLGAGPLEVRRAYREALAAQEDFEKRRREGDPPASAARSRNRPGPDPRRNPGRTSSGITGAPPPEAGRGIPQRPSPGRGSSREPGRGAGKTVGILGRTYTVQDSLLSFGLMEKLTSHGVRVLTPDSIPRGKMEENMSRLPIRPYWSAVAETVGAAAYWLNNSLVDGIIYLVSFECGPDSLTQVLLEDETRKHPETPYLALLLDEHSAETGFLTRLEAFLDILETRSERLEQTP